MTITERLPLEELASLPTVAAVTVSPDGERAAFYWDRTGRFELYVLDLRSGEVRQVTHGEAPRHLMAGFVWTRAGDAVVFSRDNDGDERQALHHLDLASGSVRTLDHAPGSMDYAVDVQPDGARVLVNSTRAGQMNVFAHDLTRGDDAVWTALTAYGAPATATGWSPDGSRFAFNTNETDDFKNRDGYVANADGTGARRVFSLGVGSEDVVGAWHPDGRRVTVTSDADGGQRVGVLDVDSGETRWLTPAGGAVEESAGRFSRDGRFLLAIRNRESTLVPVVYDVESGGARELRLPPGVTQTARFVLDDTCVLVQHASATRRPELLLYDLSTGGTRVLLPAEYGTLDPEAFVPDEYVRYPSFDGQQVPAILYRPRGARPGARLPALVHVHGGPTAQFFRGFDLYAQFLADRGYVVLCPNVRGSTGYGVAWRDANLKDWGGGDLGDVVAGAAYLKSLPEVDPERVGVFGGSFGGYMSYMAAVKAPDVFRVSVPIVGITDLHMLYEDNSRVMPQLGYYFRGLMGDPVEDADLWRDRSAVTHAANLRAPMLMLHGTNDPRCPVSQARVFRDRLLELGRREGEDFEYHEFEDEGHGPGGDIQGKIRNYRLLADFLARRL
ncbi:S9 family peptidase [Deinococcus pimensis]|uniref:S9 family peptidase n=1 Tax=Deinococcus pimensis TaxID=309888 RepID=UPI0005EB66C3|nr:S9 family peptidase [Deinococcus pimensis]